MTSFWFVVQAARLLLPKEQASRLHHGKSAVARAILPSHSFPGRSVTWRRSITAAFAFERGRTVSV
jgi:hypothetical protein